ncbi:MAG: SpoIIE family protein phosphatase, partial [Bacteroidota bacterium]|nr:SpoIIE family protein phosphatase [Bacteroidota bacterium]
EIIAQRDQAHETNKIISKQKEHITESINYAGQLQRALIPEIENVLKDFEHFILFKPKELVSGDFYWVYEHGNRKFITVADCTGHGVPGALLSVLGITFLNEILSHADKNISAADVLNKLRTRIVDVFKHDNKDEQRQDGMDMALYILEKNKFELQFAGAFNPLFVLRKKTSEQPSFTTDAKNIKIVENDSHILINLSGDSMPIGISRINKKYSNQSFNVQKGDTLYVFSDGFVDQFGGERGKKFMIVNFRKLLLNIQDKNMSEQKDFLNKTIEDWRAQYTKRRIPQLDDITILGLRV